MSARLWRPVSGYPPLAQAVGRDAVEVCEEGQEAPVALQPQAAMRSLAPRCICALP